MERSPKQQAVIVFGPSVKTLGSSNRPQLAPSADGAVQCPTRRNSPEKPPALACRGERYTRYGMIHSCQNRHRPAYAGSLVATRLAARPSTPASILRRAVSIMTPRRGWSGRTLDQPSKSVPSGMTEYTRKSRRQHAGKEVAGNGMPQSRPPYPICPPAAERRRATSRHGHKDGCGAEQHDMAAVRHVETKRKSNGRGGILHCRPESTPPPTEPPPPPRSDTLLLDAIKAGYAAASQAIDSGA